MSASNPVDSACLLAFDLCLIAVKRSGEIHGCDDENLQSSSGHSSFWTYIQGTLLFDPLMSALPIILK